ncbi:O-antigen ligase family protein [Aureispira anguillae]|uniref:O-antigen ligase family protein n=1 Tax=Aureispira anguillae TaxID=2864201 RepID=A0A916DW75_9BACT|nr:O-antigen ligase family protein [Aureispira anguillae]BDS14517.1 O-antigen ligase family protein [Aureispira anguillae]
MRSQLTIRKYSYNLFKGYALSILLSVLAAIFFETPIPFLIPIALAFVFQVLVDYEKIYFLLFMSIPLSTEVFLTDHLATDLPTEPLIVGLMLIYFFVVLTNPMSINAKYIKHPLSILIATHVLWIAISTFTSSAFGFSFKFLLAKLWYVVTFFYFTGHLVKDQKKLDRLLWLVAVPLTFATTKVILHHASLDFGFKMINTACPPFFRNHVNYAAILSVFLPFLWYLRKWANSNLSQRFAEIALLVISFGIITAYTRAAYVAVALAPIVYWVVRLRIVKLAAIIVTIGLAGILSFLIAENKFMELVPTEQTVAHTELADIVSSTSELKDVSTMERYYRWIAGTQMIAEKPVFGFGPGNFYHFYKHYTLNKFSTYVSDNLEKSGIHNYYLMTTLEQGIIGLIIFLALIYMTIIYGEQVYHNSPDRKRKDIVMASILSTIIIDAFLLMNDMIETDKIGSFFFFNIAIIVIIDLINKEEKKEKE